MGAEEGSAKVTPSFLIASLGKNRARGTRKALSSHFFTIILDIIHIVAPKLVKGQKPSKRERALLSKGVKAALDKAAQNNYKSIAIPPLATSVNNFPRKDAAAITLKTIANWLKKSGNSKAVSLLFFQGYFLGAFFLLKRYNLYDFSSKKSSLRCSKVRRII